MKQLSQPNAAWLDDDGRADPWLRGRLAESDGRLGYLRAVAALGGARLLLPIVASGDESMDGPDPDRHAEMAAVTLDHPELGRALVAFSGMDALQAWNRAARPVPCTLDDLAATVAEAGATLLVIDPAGPHPVTVLDDVVAELARGRRLVELDDGTFGWAFVETDNGAARTGTADSANSRP
ncbi:SseB family protein [Aestuariimicrobium kwangyangense]|uniref:SseB family protein n=1 Tax=Aestuariimicrobium kwangyangense TaxID=396389 RepID=UPI0003B67B7E|nr:SseB family protein [Aestuariimicrobium kwangyangense]